MSSTFGDWITYLAWTLGLRYLLGEAAIMHELRMRVFRSIERLSPPLAFFVYEGVSCSACFGWWVGIACGALYPASDGFAGVVTSALLSMVLGRLWGSAIPRPSSFAEADWFDKLMRKIISQEFPRDETEAEAEEQRHHVEAG